MNRRSFLKRFAAAVTVAVAAPMILRETIAAELPVRKIEAERELSAFWISTVRMTFCEDDLYRKWREESFKANPEFGDV
jgi:hypothetical protein